MKIVTFETQTRADRAWRTAGIHDDRQSAVAEAERILAGKRTPAVRVVQVLYDPSTSECTEYTVFRATSFDEENDRARKRVIDQEMFEWGEDARPRPQPRPKRVWTDWIDRHWPSWAPDWPASALAFSFAILAASILFRWAK